MLVPIITRKEDLKMIHLSHMTIPDQFSKEHVELAMKNMVKEAIRRCHSVGLKLKLCRGINTVEASFNGFIDKNGNLHLGFNYLLGFTTASVQAIVISYSGEFEIIF